MNLFLLAVFESGHSYPLWLIGIMIVWRILMDPLDRTRIRENISSSGGKVIDISWNPFGKGWLGERNARIYEVKYTNKDGKVITATCKTSIITGIYWSGDAAPLDFSAKAAEPTKCLSCGGSIPADLVRCPKCGWTFNESDL
jgi:hypothetical protein